MHKSLPLKRNLNFSLLTALAAVFFFALGFTNQLAAQTTTWTGAVNNVWTNSSNWSNGLPGTGSSIIINAPTGTITSVPAISLNSLTINGSGTTTLSASPSGNIITVTGTLSVASGTTLTLGQAGAKINFILSSAATGTINGTVSMNPGSVSGGNFQNSGDLTIGATGLVTDDGTNGSNFFLSSSATLRIGSVNGITTSPGLSGNIQNSGARSYSTGANYVYNGGSAQGVGNGLPATVASLTLANSSTVTLASTIAITNALTASSGTFAIGANNISAGSISMTGSSITGTGTITLNGNITSNASGSTSAIAAPISLNGANRTFTVFNNGLNPDLSISSIISGTGSEGIVKAGTGTLTLSGNNAYTGSTSINAGTLMLGNSNGLGTVAAGITVSSGAVLDLNGITMGSAEPLTLNGTGISAGGALINSGSAATYSGLISLGSSSSIVANGGITISNMGTITGSGFGLTLDGSAGGSIASIIGTGGGALAKSGSGTWILSGTNTFTGGVTLNSGTLDINNINSLGSSGTFIINGGIIDNTSGSAISTANYPMQWNGDFTFLGSQNLNLGSGNVAINGNRIVTIAGGTLTVGGTVSASTFDFTKAGSGNLVFGGNPVNVNNLLINSGTITAPSVSLNISGNFTNSGTFNNNGGTVAYVGNATQNVASVSYNNLSLSGAGLKSALGNIAVAATLNNASVFDMGGNSFSPLPGSISNTGGTIRFSGSTNGIAVNSGTVEYYGSSQTVASGTYNNLTINQSSGSAALSGATTVNGVLTLTSGILTLASNNLILGTTASISVASPSASKMIIATTSGTGEVQKSFSGIGSFTFPIGDNASNYSPITVNVTSGTFSSAYVGASVVNAKHPNNASTTNFLKRYWNINQSGISSCVATISANYVSADINGAETSIKSAQLNGGFVQASNPWLKFSTLGGNTLTVSGASVTAGQTSAFTGITGASPTISISTGSGVSSCYLVPVALTTVLGGGDPSFIYAWTPSTGLDFNNVASPNATPAITTTYTVSATDGNGITATNNTTITVNPLPTLSGAAQGPLVCEGVGAVINLTGLIPNSTGTVSYTINGAVQPPATGVASNGGGTGSFSTALLTAANNGQNLRVTGITIDSSTPNCSQPFAQNVTLGVNPVPVGIPVGPGTYRYCSGTLLSIAPVLSAGSGTFSWTGGNGSGGVGNITDTPVNNGTAPVDITYTVVPTGLGPTFCPGAAFTVVVTVDPLPVVTNVVLTQTICGTGTAGFTPTVSVASSTYSWNGTVLSGSVTGVTASGSVPVSDNLTNTGNVVATVRYRVTPTGPAPTSCVGGFVDFVVTVNPGPVMAIVNPITTICDGSATNITLNSATSNALITLQSVSYGPVTGGTLSAPQTFTPGFTVAETLTNNTAGPLTVNYSFSVGANGCTNAGPFNASVTVQPGAVFVVSNSPSSLCQGTPTNIVLGSGTVGEQVTLKGVVATGGVTGFSAVNTVYNGFPATVADNLANPTNAPQTVTYTFEGGIGGACANPVQQAVTVTVNPAPPNLSINNLTASICSGSPVSVTVNSLTANALITLTNVSYNGAIGTLSNGTTFSPGFKITEALQNSTNAPITVSYIFQVSANGCSNPTTQTTNVIVDPIPNASANNNLICSGTSTGITITNPNNVSGTLYTWTVAATNVSGANNQPTPTASPISDVLTATTNNQGSAVYTITPVSPAGCLGASYVSTVTVQPIPSFSLNNNTPQICSGSQVNILLNTPTSGGQVRIKSVNYNGATGTLSAGDLYSNGQSITEVLTNSTTLPITVTYQFEAIVGACAPSAVQTTTVVVNPNPSFTINNTTSTICSGTQPSIILSSATSGASIALQNVNYGALTGGLYAAGGTFSTGAVITESAGGLVNNTNDPISVTYTFSVSTPLTTPVCPLSTSTQTATVQVLPTPSFSLSNSAGLICSGGQANITLNTTVSGTQIELTSVSYGSLIGTLSSGLLYSNGQKITEVIVNPTNSPATVTYYFQAIVGGCSPSALQSANVTVNPTPVFSITNNTTAVCEGSPVNIILNSPTSNAVITLSSVNYNSMAGTLSSGLTFTDGQSITETISTPFVATTQATYSFTVAASGCSNPVAQQAFVAVTKQATVSLPADYIVCQPATIALTGTMGGSAVTGLWSIVTGAGTLSATSVSGHTVTANYAVDPADVSTIVTFRLTTDDPDGSGPCQAAFADINITINQAAQVFAPANLALCQNISGIALSGSIGGSTTTTVWTHGPLTTAGTFSNVNDPNATYFFDPSEVNKTAVLTLTALDPDGSGPCTNVSTQTNLKINPLPTVIFSGLPTNGSPPQIAQNNSPLVLTGNQSGGQFTISLGSNIGSTSSNPVDQVTFNPSAAKIGLDFVTYTFTDANGCTNSNAQYIQVNAVTIVDFALLPNTSGQTVRLNSNNQWEVCANQGNVVISGLTTPPSSGKPGSTITKFRSISYLGGPVASIQSDPLNVDNWYLVTNGLTSGTYEIEYDFENVVGAVDTTQRFIHVFASPTPGISAPNSCVTSSITFTDASVMPSVNPFGGVINSWAWNLDPFLSNTQNPTINYPTTAPGTKSISLIASTNQGCSATATSQIKVGDFPVPNFDWSGVCNFDKTVFKDRTVFNSGQGNIVQYTWQFGDTTKNVSGAPALPITGYYSTSGTYTSPKHVYPTFGKNYDATMTVNTDVGCTQSITKTVFILPTQTIQPSAASSYNEYFQSSDGGWVPQSLSTANYSWKWGVPSGSTGHIQPRASNDFVWWTGANSNTYYALENSVINGPCFDLTQLNRPMIALDYSVDATVNFDGAVMQYSTNGGLNWHLVGPKIPSPRVQGINWYKPTSTIIGNPGGQSVGPFGWSDTLKIWKNGRFNLDVIPKDSLQQVRIRIAFAAYGKPKGYDGFAFDNIFVGEKTKNVLIEEFTNANLTASLTADTYFNKIDSVQILIKNGKRDFRDIQYHVSFPSPDVFNLANTEDPAARALSYGVQQPPYAVLDGLKSVADGATTISFGNNFSNIDTIEIDRRALRKPLISIYKVDTIATGKNNTINARMHIRADTAITFPLYAQVALIEDSVVIAPSTHVFRNVVRKLLYVGGAGLTTTAAMNFNDSLIFTNGAVTINTPIGKGKLYLVAFIQNNTSKEIIQSMVVPVKHKIGSVVTAIESSIGNLASIQIYPNPANAKFNFALPGDFPEGSIYKISDQRGINVLGGDFNDAYKGEKTVDVSSLTNGMYIVAIGAPGQGMVYRKLVVLNSN